MVRFSFVNGELLSDDSDSLGVDQLLSAIDLGTTPYLLQPVLRPHPDLRPIMPGEGLGTTRIVTVNKDGAVKVVFACVRISVGNNIGDNFSAGETGNILADINVHTGRIGDSFVPSVSNPNLLVPCPSHPESGEEITGFVFPQWKKIMTTVEHAALSLGESLYTVGWDVALTSDGPCLIEANWRYDIDLLQIAAQRGLKAELMPELQPALDRIA